MWIVLLDKGEKGYRFYNEPTLAHNVQLYLFLYFIYFTLSYLTNISFIHNIQMQGLINCISNAKILILN